MKVKPFWIVVIVLALGQLAPAVSTTALVLMVVAVVGFAAYKVAKHLTRRSGNNNTATNE